MGIRSGSFVFLRPSCYGDSERTGRPGTREKEIGFERERDTHTHTNGTALLPRGMPLGVGGGGVPTARSAGPLTSQAPRFRVEAGRCRVEAGRCRVEAGCCRVRGAR